AFNTFRVGTNDALAAIPGLGPLLAGSRVLIQPFLEGIESEGEWSLVFIEGSFSHAVLKRPGAGEFRVQEEHGGSATPVTAPSGHVPLARATLAAATDRSLLYARVDMVRSGQDVFIMECELTEPTLYLVHDPRAPERFANALAGKLKPS